MKSWDYPWWGDYLRDVLNGFLCGAAFWFVVVVVLWLASLWFGPIVWRLE